MLWDSVNLLNWKLKMFGQVLFMPDNDNRFFESHEIAWTLNKEIYKKIVNVLSIPDKHASCDSPCPNSRDSTTTRYNHLAGLVYHFPESKNRSFKNALRSGASGGLSSTSGPMIAPLEAGCLGQNYLWWTGEAAGNFDIIDCISQTWKISKMSGVRRCDSVNVWIHSLSI